MKTVYSEDHRLHFPQAELAGGQFVTPFERPSRVEYVLQRLREVGMTDIAAPDAFDPAPVARLHDAGYLEFLKTGWDAWKAAGFAGEMIAASFPARRQNTERVPDNIDGKVGFYALASETAITGGTWRAAQASCSVAQTAQRCVQDGAAAAFALCRPPGHHATRDQFGGYCFVNNAAVAAEMAIMAGCDRAAILDVDFHHGNGTQDIFYDRADVLFCSLHGRPEDAFPYFTGFADETGAGVGEGFNVNYPMSDGTAWDVWGDALSDAIGRIRDFGPDMLVVSLGVDAFEKDPISAFKLTSDDYARCGEAIGRMRLPTVFVMEGGYAIEEVGINTVNVLQGFEAV
jgi:acetoin utilization deacetylase AcuC-like enzyme